MNKTWSYPFIAVSMLHILGLVLNNEMLCSGTKPLLIPTLALLFWQETRHISAYLRTAWLIGLFFSTLGDILLMFSGGLFFMLGLAAFLLAHICFILAIRVGIPAKPGFLKQKPGWILLFLLYPTLILYMLWAGIPAGMRLPVAIYAAVIGTMAASSANLWGYVSAKIFWTILSGALLFVLSDSLLAINKFGSPFSGGHLLVMLTYISGQYLLVRGVIAVLQLRR